MLIPGDHIITVDDDLYRRIPKKPDFFNFEAGKPTSAAFKPRKSDNNRLSVDIVALTTPRKTVMNPELFTIALFSAQIPIGHGLQCLHELDTNFPENKAHASIVGEKKPFERFANQVKVDCVILDDSCFKD